MRLKVDRQLLAEARRVLGVESPQGLVDLALREALRNRQLAAIDVLAALPLDLDPAPIHYGPPD